MIETMKNQNPINIATHELIGLAWADEVSFDAIKRDTGVSEKDLIKIMRDNLKPKSFKVWRTRVSGRKTKHELRAQKG